ncbi:hypothetical protein Trydic_g3695 [Trypoxylus dichotomus]
MHHRIKELKVLRINFLSIKLLNYSNIIQQHEITKEDLLVSFDVESLFTKVPVEETLEIIKQQLISRGLQPDLNNLARHCLTWTYFLWNGEFYEQASGAAMGSSLSPVIANIFMEAFEHEAIESSRMKPKCWYRYVGVTFVIWPHGSRTLEEFLQNINRQHANINFTIEIEEDSNSSFLDVLVEGTDSNKLGHSMYRKKIHTDRYLDAISHRHPQRKRSLINTLLRRAEKISDEHHGNSEIHHVNGRTATAQKI